MRIPYDVGRSSVGLGHGCSLNGHGPTSESARTVLIIDDDRQVHQLMQRFLTNEGWNVVTASSGPGRHPAGQAASPGGHHAGRDDVRDGRLVGAVEAQAPIRRRPCAPVVMVSIIDDKRMGFALGAARTTSPSRSTATRWCKVLSKLSPGQRTRPGAGHRRRRLDPGGHSPHARAGRLARLRGGPMGSEAVEKMKKEGASPDSAGPDDAADERLRVHRRSTASTTSGRAIPVVVVSGPRPDSNAEREQLNGCVKAVIHKNSARLRP